MAAARKRRLSPWWPTEEQTRAALLTLESIPAPVYWLPMTWTSAGCLVAARALQRWGGGDLMAVELPLADGGVYIEHVVVRIGADRYLDARGAHTGEELRREMALTDPGSERKWRIAPCAIREAQRHIFDSRHWVDRLSTRLEQVGATARDLTGATTALA